MSVDSQRVDLDSSKKKFVDDEEEDSCQLARYLSTTQ